MDICIMEDQELELDYAEAQPVEDSNIENFYIALTSALERLKEHSPVAML
jgi:hypothetical protein